MAPARSRKRVKTNPSPEEAPKTPPTQIPLPPDPTSAQAAPDQQESPAKQTERPSWYNRTWPRKAPPVTQVARESISTAGNVASEALSTVARKGIKPIPTRRSSSLQLTRGNSSLNRSLPADATTTRVNALSTGSFPKLTSPVEEEHSDRKQREVPGEPTSRILVAAKETRERQENGHIVGSESSKPNHKALTPMGQADGTEPHSTNVSNSGWLGWFSRPVAEAEKITQDPIESAKLSDPTPPQAPTPQEIFTEPESVPQADAHEATQSSPPKRGWLQIWGNDSKPAMDASGGANGPTVGSPNNVDKLLKPQTENLAAPTVSASHSNASSIKSSPPPDLPGDASKSSGWIFWSRDRKGNSANGLEESHVGELAISDTPSQKRPKRASISFRDRKDLPSVGNDSQSSKGKETPRSGTPTITTQEPKVAAAEPSVASKVKTQEQEASRRLQKPVPNLLLPSFKDTFSMQESPSLLQQLGRFLNYAKPTEPTHLSLVPDPPRINNAIAIGVHGYFPAPFIRSVLGQPTGTSIKFADMAAKAIRTWTQARGYSCEVKIAALEGEGRVAERMEMLWKLLLNWLDEIRKADFIMVACHSQGVPVAMMLVAKLISFGCVNSARIGICAMAGVSMGPFPEFRSRWFGERANELFDFSNPSSTVSKDYLAALEAVLKFGVRVVYAGSVDDQLVSLESSTFSPVSHPHIYRAVFVDGRIHTPNFLAHLVGFALKLRNLGVPDHGLIRELSSPLAGSLYSGEGHSRIYDDDAVYFLAVEFALETTSFINHALLTQNLTGNPSSNPYILPFAMRGLLEEPKVKTELNSEATELLQQFDEWKPTTKVLKDVKFRLEGIRSKL